MPIYEYQCPKCGQVTEKISPASMVRISCPVCGTPSPRKISRIAAAPTGGTCSPTGGNGFT